MIHTAYDGSLNFDTRIDTGGFTKGTNTIKSQAKGLKSILFSLGKTMAVVFGVRQLIRFGKQAVETASDLQEVQNVVDTAFGSMSYKMEEFAKTSIETFGLSKLAAKQTGSTFMAMAKNMVSSEKAASDMAVALTGLSGDWSSFYNVSQSEAATALNSIFTGETETIKRYGYVMTEANLQAFALEKGIKKQVSAMSQEEKVMLRYNYIMEKSAIVQGDFAKTSGSWANQTRVLSEKWKEFLGLIGTGLIQVLTPVVKFISSALSYLISFANTIGGILSSIFNLEQQTGAAGKATESIGSGAEDAAVGLNDMGDAAKKANKKASGLSGIDQLNNITDSMGENAENAADALAMLGGGGKYGMEIATNVNPADTSALETGLSTAIANIKTGLSTFLTYIQTSFAPIFSSIWVGLQSPIQNFKIIFATVFANLQSLVQPLLDYFTGSYIPYLQQTFITIGEILIGLFNSFNMVFSDIWNLAVYPLLQNLLTVLLPMLADIGTQIWGVVSVLFEEIKGLFDMLWQDVMAPVIAECMTIWTDFINLLAEFWDTWGKPIFDGIKTAIKTTGDLLKTTWEKFLKPIWDKIMKVVDELWTKHMKPLLKNIGDFIGALVTGALDIYNKFIAPIVKWFVEKLGPPIAKVISGIVEVFGDMVGNIIDAINGVITALTGIVQFIAGVFTGDWKKAWEGVKNIFKGIFDALVGIVKTPINMIIDIINGLVSGIVAGVNTVIKAINSISISIPGWVPVIGGNKIGFDLKELTAPKIPKLATGTVIPPNSEFLALLGDQKKGVNIEAPLDTIVEAFRRANREDGGSGNGVIHIHFDGDARGLFKLIRATEEEHYRTTNKAVFVH